MGDSNEEFNKIFQSILDDRKKLPQLPDPITPVGRRPNPQRRRTSGIPYPLNFVSNYPENLKPQTRAIILESIDKYRDKSRVASICTEFPN